MHVYDWVCISSSLFFELFVGWLARFSADLLPDARSSLSGTRFDKRRTGTRTKSESQTHGQIDDETNSNQDRDAKDDETPAAEPGLARELFRVPAAENLLPRGSVLQSRFSSVSSVLVHKKINLGESVVLWEHERFSLRRIPGLTLSRLEEPSDPSRRSLLDTRCVVDLQRLRRNGEILAETLGRFMFNLSHMGSASDLQLFTGKLVRTSPSTGGNTT
ncbi:nicalin-1-like [Boleophthalmus pectinirostris]|uniref:nicalin-1-like n=1 Tax=Boleophthalmus pectinirostris TaxID=150288 RepID=UPI002431BB54|nr:nicalin-1-like [Boleophthalmus pectinirostris]